MKNFQSLARTKDTRQDCEQDPSGPVTAQCKGYAARTSFPLPVQKKSAKGSLPSGLKEGIENLSGLQMDDVRVHYNSSRPSGLQALAYTQGADIHLGPGQEKHLEHEAWHVVQQRQGRVKPTMHLGAVGINNDPGLEREADRLGAKAKNYRSASSQESQPSASGGAVQAKKKSSTPAATV